MVRVQIHPNNANFPSTGQRLCWNREICVLHMFCPAARAPRLYEKKLLADLLLLVHIKREFLYEDLGFGKDAP
jgi:hypothetical protein